MNSGGRSKTPTRMRLALAFFMAWAAGVSCGGQSSSAPEETSGQDMENDASSLHDASGADAAASAAPDTSTGPGLDAATADAPTNLDATVEDAAGPGDSGGAPADASGIDARADGKAPVIDAGHDASTSTGSGDAGSDARGPCRSDQLDCGGICVPNDAVNCGSCGHDCTALHATSTASCAAGQCVFPGLTCAPGWAHCSNDAGDGCEANITTAAHCGACGVACTSPPICATGGGTPACVKAVALSEGTANSFVLFSNGSVDSWGSDWGGYQSETSSNGQLGTNAPSNVVYTTATPTAVLTTGTVTAIASGDSHSCALLANGTVECWGDNFFGELGQDIGVTQSSVPVVVPGLSNVMAIDVGGTISCALITGGTVECWGNDDDGELASTNIAVCNGFDNCSPTPVTIPGLTGVTAIAVGNSTDITEDHVCALLGNGTIKCWGYNGNGEVGNGTVSTTGGVSTPVTVSGITTATAIEGHEYGHCALLTGGTVKCWGSGTNGELGNGSTNAAPTPVTVSGLTDAQSLSVGSTAETVCAVRATGTAVCWGFNGNAQLGNGAPSSTMLSDTPVPVSNLTNVAQVAGSTFHMCAVLTTGEVWCWGDNGNSELANTSVMATVNYNPTPLPVQW